MTLSLFWSRYTLELREQHLRAVDEKYQYLIARERWNWLLAKIPESEQIRILRGHNHGDAAWTCKVWLEHMIEWIRENKSTAVYEAVLDKIEIIKMKTIEELEKQAAYGLSPEELRYFQDAGYFQWISEKTHADVRSD